MSNVDKLRAKIKFSIYAPDGTLLSWLDSNDAEYQKIEYIYEDDKYAINFLLGYDKTWKLWAGKNGAVSYDIDPYIDLEVEDFVDAILQGVDEILNLIKKVKDSPSEYPQYINM